MVSSDASGTLGEPILAPLNEYRGKIIGELLGIQWSKTPQDVNEPSNAYYLFYTKNIQTATKDDNGNSVSIENASGYFYIIWKSCDIVDEKGNVIPYQGKDPETFWRGLFSGWGSGKQWLKSNVAPKDESLLGQLWYYFLKYWWILLILFFWNTIKGLFSDFQKIGKKLIPKR